jgi:hypothetical protein
MKPTPETSLEWVSWLYCAASRMPATFSRKMLMKIVTNIKPLSSRVQILDGWGNAVG